MKPTTTHPSIHIYMYTVHKDDSFNFVFYIVGQCISCAADTQLATDLTCYCSQRRASPNCTDVPSTSHNPSVWCDYHKCLLSLESHEWLSGLVRLCLLVLFPSLSHHTSLQGLLYWPPTKNDFMMMGRSSSLYMTNSAFKSTTSRHLTTRSMKLIRMDISDNQPVWLQNEGGRFKNYIWNDPPVQGGALKNNIWTDSLSV